MAPSPRDPAADRRDFLRFSAGLAGLSLGANPAWGSILAPFDGLQAPAGARLGPHFPAKAKRLLFLYMFGGPSQMDLFDYKPELQKRHGQTIRFERLRGDFKDSVLLGSQRTFARHGQTGQWCSDAFVHLPRHIDKLAIIKSLWSDSFAHGSGVLQMNTGQTRQGYPALGSWVLHGLGSENPKLPGFVVMHDPRGGPISGPANWSSAFMPASLQGTLFRSTGEALLDLRPAWTQSGRSTTPAELQRAQIDLIRELDARHAAARPGESEYAARAANYELAHELQASASEALDLTREDARTLAAYGLDAARGEHPLSLGPAPFGRQLLIARRLLERGVRVVQIYHGGGHQQQTWDAHHGVEENLAIHCPEVDRPLAALFDDLERSGLLQETLIVWGGEFGRQPVSQQEEKFQDLAPAGRGHNPKGFTMWLAGAGVRPGSYGETDELGAEAAVDRHHLRDLHATILYLMGLDHEQLTYRFGGLDRKLTGVVEAHPICGVVA